MNNDRSRLRALIEANFSLGELQPLCLDLGMEFAALPGGKAAKVLELITYMERQGRLEELVQTIHRLRPNLIVVDDQTIQEFERYFQDPSMEADDVIRPPLSGQPPLAGDACRNIRTALGLLGYGNEHGDTYDEPLRDLVLQFQRDHNHKSKDGYFGPGTRRLLVKAFIEKYGTHHFRRWVDPTDRRKYLIKLRQRLSTYFSEGELKTLCFDLGIDYDDLPDNGRENKARELIQYFERRSRIPELVEACQGQRPQVPWTSV